VGSRNKALSIAVKPGTCGRRALDIEAIIESKS
jgi:hypothetical protein